MNFLHPWSSGAQTCYKLHNLGRGGEGGLLLEPASGSLNGLLGPLFHNVKRLRSEFGSYMDLTQLV